MQKGDVFQDLYFYMLQMFISFHNHANYVSLGGARLS